jgi:hypothetical protein
MITIPFLITMTTFLITDLYTHHKQVEAFLTIILKNTRLTDPSRLTRIHLTAEERSVFRRVAQSYFENIRCP